MRVLEFLDDKIEVIPSVVGKQSRVERERNLRDISLGSLEVEVLSVA